MRNKRLSIPPRTPQDQWATSFVFATDPFCSLGRVGLPSPKAGLGCSTASKSKISTAQKKVMPSLGETKQHGSLVAWCSMPAFISLGTTHSGEGEAVTQQHLNALPPPKPGNSLSEDGFNMAHPLTPPVLCSDISCLCAHKSGIKFLHPLALSKLITHAASRLTCRGQPSPPS